MSPGAIIHTSSFIMTGPGKLLVGIHIQTYREQGDFIRLLQLFQNKVTRLQIDKRNKKQLNII
jgi:hypothetical protein